MHHLTSAIVVLTSNNNAAEYKSTNSFQENNDIDGIKSKRKNDTQFS